MRFYRTSYSYRKNISVFSIFISSYLSKSVFLPTQSPSIKASISFQVLKQLLLSTENQSFSFVFLSTIATALLYVYMLEMFNNKSCLLDFESINSFSPFILFIISALFNFFFPLFSWNTKSSFKFFLNSF